MDGDSPTLDALPVPVRIARVLVVGLELRLDLGQGSILQYEQAECAGSFIVDSLGIWALGESDPRLSVTI